MNSTIKTSITPFLTVSNGTVAVAFYTSAFGAEVTERYEMPNGKLTAKICINDSVFWLGDEEPEYNNLSPQTIGDTAVRIILTADDPDNIFNNALKAGAIQICPITTEEFWRIGKLKDPFGHIWEIGKPLP